MEIIISIGVGILAASGVFLLLSNRSFSIIISLALLSYAANILIFASGRLSINAYPLILPGSDQFADPLPQALVLTAIVISFGMTAYLVAFALRVRQIVGDDHINEPHIDRDRGQS
jgi:multicomponent K+:H+ antiporter subunit C